MTTPAIAIDDTVFAASSSGKVYAADALDGNQLWTAFSGNTISNLVSGMGLAAADGYLIVITADGVTV